MAEGKLARNLGGGYAPHHSLSLGFLGPKPPYEMIGVGRFGRYCRCWSRIREKLSGSSRQFNLFWEELRGRTELISSRYFLVG